MCEPIPPAEWPLRAALEADVPALEALIADSARALQMPTYSRVQIDAAIGPVFGVDRQLIHDGTYFVVEHEGVLIGCGGWSRRRSLYGGDAGQVHHDEWPHPETDAARIRAFFVHPDFARQGIGRTIMVACESAIRAAGFRRVEIVATLAGEPLYAAFGCSVVERFEIPLPRDLRLPVVRMAKVYAA
jgi:N-acetylglutamate synthase-like GNAT family acetyltransferase